MAEIFSHALSYIWKFVDLFLHLDKHLSEVIATYGNTTYFILFAIIFCETGLVVTPILPGDSLLFAAGAFAATGALDLWTVIGLLLVAAILGDTINYSIGNFMGPKAFAHKDSKIFKPQYLKKTQEFYDRFGGMTIIIARFVPIVRTFAPFVAGVSSMHYRQFITYNVIGAILWVHICVLAGFWFGNLSFVRDHFSLVVLMIIFISVLPGIIEGMRAYRNRNNETMVTEKQN